MSSFRRHQEDLRKIVGVSETVGGLDPAEDRLPVNGKRGIFLINSGEIKSGDTPSNGTPVMPDENADNENADGSGTGGSGTGGSGSGGAGTGVGDFIENPNANPPGFDTGADDLFGGNWGSGISEYVDCATGQGVNLNRTGQSLIPSDYDDVDYDILFKKTSGFFWTVTNAPPVSSANSIGSAGWTPAMALAIWNVGYTRQNEDATPFPITCPTISPTYVTSRSCTTGQARISMMRITCGSGPWDPGSNPDKFCNETFVQPEVSKNPYYSPVRVSPDIELIKNTEGQWSLSEFSAYSAKYSEPKSILDLCTPSGDGVQVLPAKDGGSVEWNYTKGIWGKTPPGGTRPTSFGGASSLTAEVVSSVSGGGYIKEQGASVPSG